MRQSIGEKFQANVNKCDICYSPYDRQQKKPVIICSMHHTVCNQCVNALKGKPECPFCRERIRFEKVVVNNYIYELLPYKAVIPNQRFEVERPSAQIRLNRKSHITEDKHDDSRLPMGQESINNRPLEQAYPNHYEYNAPISSVVVETDVSLSSENSPYYCFFCIQIPFALLNLLFALTEPKSECMDKPHGQGFLILRPWLLSMGIVEVVAIVIFLLVTFCRKQGCISSSALKSWYTGLMVLLVVKILVWAFVELPMFKYTISPYCSGGIFAYGVVMTIINGAIVLIISAVACITGNCK